MRVRGCALIERKDSLLVLAYDYPNGRIFAIPGGGVKEGETLAAGVERELQEEVGVQIQIGPLRYVGDMMAQAHIKQTVHVIFEATIVKGNPKLNARHTSAVELVWLPKAALNQVKLYPAINVALEEDRPGTRPRVRYLGDCMSREWA